MNRPGRTLILRAATLVSCLFALASPPQADAVDKYWTGATSTAWSTNGNWTGNAPSAGDNAVFNGTFTNQPTVGGGTSAGGIWMTGSIGQNVTISGTGALQLSGGTINGTTGLGILIDNANAFTLTINAPLTLAGNQTWRNNSANLLTIGGAVNLNNKTFAIDGSGNTTVTGVMSGGGAFTKTGTGTLTLSGNNTYTGGTTINGGTIVVNSATSLGANTGGLTINAGTLEVVTGYTSTRATTLGNSASTFQIDASQTYTVNSVMAGTGALNKTGSGTMVLGGANTFSGGTVVSAGTLQLSASDRLLNTGALTVSGGTFDLQTFNETTGAVTLLSGSIIGTGSATLTGSSYAVQSGTISAILAGTGALTKTTSGTVTLSGVNTYTGGSTINAGTVIVNNAASLGATSGGLTINAGTLEVASGFSTSRVITLGNSASTVQVDSGQTYTVTSAIGGTGSLNKTGSGTMTLTGTNTFTGNTVVSGGTLLAAGSAGAALGTTAAITVNNGGTLQLGADNQINNAAGMTLAGGTFARGNFNEGSASAAGVGALTLSASGSHIDFGTGSVGVLTFASLNANAFTLTIDNWTGNANTMGNGTTDRLIFSSDQASNLNNFFFTGYGAGAVEFNLGNGYWEIVAASAVPEPRTWLVGVLGVGAIAMSAARRFPKKRA